MTDEYLPRNDALASNFLGIFASKVQPAYLKEWMELRSVVTREFSVFFHRMWLVEGHWFQLFACMHVLANWNTSSFEASSVSYRDPDLHTWFG